MRLPNHLDEMGAFGNKEIEMPVKLLLLLTVVLLCAGHPAVAAPAEEVVIPGSGNPEYALGKLAEQFNASQSAIHVTVPTSTGTAGALRDVEAGVATLGRVGRPLQPRELDKGLTYLPLGRDPVVFAGGAAVTARNITNDQISGIYGGTITDWSALGGKPAHIRVIGREVTDASRRAIGKYYKPFADMTFGDAVKVVNLDPEMIALLDRFPTSLGFLNTSALKACTTKIVVLDYNGLTPSVANMENGSYPLWLEFGLIYKPGALTAADKAFLAYLRGPAAQNLLRDLGVQPIVTKER